MDHTAAPAPVRDQAAGVQAATSEVARAADVAAFAARLGVTPAPRARCAEPLLPLLASALWSLRAGEERRGLAVLVADDDRARELAEGVAWYLPAEAVTAYLPSRGVAYGSGLDPAVHLVGERARAFAALAAGGLVAVSAEALCERVTPPGERPASVRISSGETLERDDLIAALVGAGYTRVDRVEERGQLAARGDIVDVFPSTGASPLRIELFGDEIERISFFSAFTQRSLATLDAAELHAAAEVAPGAGRPPRWGEEDGDERVPAGLVSPLPLLIAAGALIAWQPDRLMREVDEFLLEAGSTLPAADRARAYVRAADVHELVAGAAVLDPLLTGVPAFEALRPALSGRGLAEAENELRALVDSGHRVLVAFPHRGDAERTVHSLRRVQAPLLDWGEALPSEPGVRAVVSPLRRGVVVPWARLAVLPSVQVFRRRAVGGETAQRLGRAYATVADLRPGDHIVHEDHGIARFAGFDTKTVADVTRDYVELVFRGDDRIFMPHEQLSKISRYIGADARSPALSKLGGKAWEALRARARVAVRELAGELLALYAARQTRVRPPFEGEDAWMARLEAAFPYTETEDQARAIEETIADLDSEQPMDRLICGDVGFGKTEVAMRAAFKVITSGRQVLMLVPTTILATQHLQTFRDRFRDFPVAVEMVSRMRVRADIKQVLKRFEEGKVDVLIGTHRVLGRDVVAKDLGLVLLDEEQRFGVAQKELLRQLRLEVDVLSLSATPIPRTLHMSLAGLRDISIILTPPRGRRPIRTHVGEWDAELIVGALRRETARGGQSFYLHNRVETIDEAAEKLRRMAPELRVLVGHGQMAERQLEDVMAAFLRGDADVLCSTTIIESGLDIPQANTLVVERADLLGLSQLYQIRGRVGRSDESSHAYLLYPDARELSEEARSRLSALADYTELGSGYRVAMRDLELRGAGNLLGDEQSGHVAALGFDLYCEMLAEAVAELQGTRARALRPVRIEAQVDAYVPAGYVGLESVKVDVHRRIALAHTVDALRDLRVELADRFGEPPTPVEHLIALQEVRLRLPDAGCDTLVLRGGRLTVGRVALEPAQVRAVRAELPEAGYSGAAREVTLRVGEADPVDKALDLVDAIIRVRRATA